MYLPLFLCLYESFWKGFESDQRLNIARYQMGLLVWRVVNKTLKFRLMFLMLTINSRSPWEMISGFKVNS